MSIRKILLAAAAATLLAAPASAATFRYAFQGDLNALDPYTLNETFTLGALGNVMEGLTKRDKDLKIIPGLAERWETSDDGRRWRFYLRRNVKYHDGSPFTADDVIFSAERAQADGSQIKSRLPDKFKIEKVDDHTVDFVMPEPNPILHYEWDTWYIFSKPWADKVGATKPQSATATSLNAWALTANGTGPFRLESHQPGVKTVFKPNPDWWGKPEHNLTEVDLHHHQVGRDARRRAAVGRDRHDGSGPGPGHRADQVEPERHRDDRSGAAHDLPQHGLVPGRAPVLERQGQESVQGRPRPQGVLPGDRHRGDQEPGDARQLGAVIDPDLAALVLARGRDQAPPL